MDGRFGDAKPGQKLSALFRVLDLCDFEFEFCIEPATQVAGNVTPVAVERGDETFEREKLKRPDSLLFAFVPRILAQRLTGFEVRPEVS